MASDGADGDERAPKRARLTAEPLDGAMDATREQLARTTDSHLQAKLLLQYSAQAVAPAAATEAAIDFLFAFLQQSQLAANGDQTKSPPSGDGSSSKSGGDSNAVVMAAIVRGLRGLLAVKPHLVEPMIQLDAMGEQLTQCISVPEDFKLRRDMLRIVLDCLVASSKFREAEQLLRACVADHDDGICGASLDGYLRLFSAGHRLDATAVQELADRLCNMLLQGDDERTRATATQLLGMLAETSFESSVSSAPVLRDTILNTLATVVRDPSPRVRLQVAMAFRGFRAATTPDALYRHLLYKRQINEDLAEIDTQSVAMLTSGALLSLLEDDKLEVAIATSTSMRTLCDAGFWSADLIDRALSTHIELAARVANHHEHVTQVLQNLRAFLKQWNATEKSSYRVSCEELGYLLGSLPTTTFAVMCEVFAVLRFLAVDTPQKASRVIQFLIQCSKHKLLETTDAALAQSLRASTEQLVERWVELGLAVPFDTMVTLRGAASGSSVNAVTASCQQIHDGLCPPSDRLAERQSVPVTTSNVRVPSFLDAK